MRIFSKSVALFFVCASLHCPGARADEDKITAAAQELIEIEGKFYQTGQEKGTRAAFLEYLADDGIMFQPEPGIAKKAWEQRKESGVSLIWRPIFAAMARSCDFGYTTGPAEWKKSKAEEKPFGHGQFVSVWKKQADGSWKLALDVGTENPPPATEPGAPLVSVPQNGSASISDLETARRTLRGAQKTMGEVAKSDYTAAVMSGATDDIRLFREGVFPAVGKDAAALMLSANKGKMLLRPIGGDLSSSGDIGYTYGKYSLTRGESTENGHYLHIWRTDATGSWKLALDLQKKLPPAAPSKRKKKA